MGCAPAWNGSAAPGAGWSAHGFGRGARPADAFARRSRMIDPHDPPRGSMYLYDDITPPTLDGSYTMTVSTDITFDGATQGAPIERHFDVVGPRFSLDPTVVANVYPPRNGQGSYQDALPQIVLGRRTLPWERSVGNVGPIPGDSPPQGQVPWLALLLF